MKKIALLGILLALTIFTLGSLGITALKEDDAQPSPVTADLTLVVGSPLVLSEGTVKRLDSDNPALAPKVVKRHTLVPLRAFSEHFGAQVSYDGDKQEATILYNGKKAVFGAGKLSFFFDEKEYPLKTPAAVYEGSLLVPLRAVAETVFGQVVSYYSGMIYVGREEKDIENDAAFQKITEQKIGEAKRPQTIEELKDALRKIGVDSYDIRKKMNQAVDDASNSAAVAASEPEPARGVAGENYSKTDAQAEKTAGEEYSKTNIQVEGIDEADIVKTDGKNLYVAANKTVYIVSADGADMALRSKIALDGNRYVSELYADGERLIVIGQRYEEGGDVHIMEKKLAARSIMVYPYNNKSRVFVFVYDVSAPESPVKIRELEIEGNLSTSRKNGDFLYVVANKSLYSTDVSNAAEGDIMPLYKDGENAEEQPVGIDKVICPPVVSYPTYATIAALDLSDPGKDAAVESILGANQELYMNADSLYLTRSEYLEGGSQTVITRFSIDGTKIGYSASGVVSGLMENQFWMDESDGYLRVATTDTEDGNNLFVLDGGLNPVGSITGIAKGERIYSVRFIGDKGYIVTFRTIDPLFAIDLSDPSHPAVKGELKIPGFSDYLHPVGENLLLGIGYDTKETYVRDENGRETVVGVYQGGIKLSLFDVSDMAKPVEKDTLVLGGQGSFADAMENHKAIMTDPANGLIGFDASLYDDKDRAQSFSGALLIKAGEDGLSEKGRIEAKQGEAEAPGDMAYIRRLVYIGDTLYYLQDGRVRAFDYETLAEKDSLTLK